jgi:hypothetical protein
MAAGLHSASPFKEASTNKTWKKDCFPAIQSNILKLQHVAESLNIDCGVIAERLRATTEIVRGYKPIAAM